MAATAGRGGMGLGAVLGKRTEGVAPAVWARQMFTRSRIPKEVRAAVVEDTEKRHQGPSVRYIRMKSVVGSWGLAHQPRLHKNIPSVNSKLKVVKHLIRFDTAAETTLRVANRRGNVRHLSYEQGRTYH
uniref:39S ribosomal protein L30, mitochondrial n=1 Tax=Anser cygnoides TaxID=8845 RepID=A0A8B9EQQ5_ANSCY